MVILETQRDPDSTATESDSEDGSNEAENTDSTDSRSPMARLVSAAETLATLVEPFSALLTSVVQAATVITLVRKA